MAKSKKNVKKTDLDKATVVTASTNTQITRDNIDLAKARVATGETQSPTLMSLLEKNFTPYYSSESLESYSKTINAMNLPELQEHAYKVGEIPLSRRDVLIDRLEKRFLEHKGRNAQLNEMSKFAKDDMSPESKERLLKIMRNANR